MTPVLAAAGVVALIGCGWIALWRWALGPPPPALSDDDIDKLTEGRR